MDSCTITSNRSPKKFFFWNTNFKTPLAPLRLLHLKKFQPLLILFFEGNGVNLTFFKNNFSWKVFRLNKFFTDYFRALWIHSDFSLKRLYANIKGNFIYYAYHHNTNIKLLHPLIFSKSLMVFLWQHRSSPFLGLILRQFFHFISQKESA